MKDHVSEEQSAILHSLLVDAMEGSLRQQLMSGEYNPQVMARVMDFLKHNNIQVASHNSKRMRSLTDLLSNIDPEDLQG